MILAGLPEVFLRAVSRLTRSEWFTMLQHYNNQDSDEWARAWILLDTITDPADKQAAYDYVCDYPMLYVKGDMKEHAYEVMFVVALAIAQKNQLPAEVFDTLIYPFPVGL